MVGQTGIAVGARIRALRAERGLSLSALAAAAGIGKGSLSELENGQRNPTLDTLYALAGPLGVPLGALVDFRDGAVIADAGFEGVLLHTEHAEGATTEVYLLRVTAGVTRSSPPHAPGVVEQLVVISGTCRVDHAGGSVDVGPGEHASWPADAPHTYRVLGAADLRAVNVITTPTR